jgi:hypothetical protein
MIFFEGNIDVVTRILEFVAASSEDLNTCAMVSRSFRLARSDPRLDQTRTGTIIFKTPLGDILPKVWQRWDQQVFVGNRSRLVAIITELQHSTKKSPLPLINIRKLTELQAGTIISTRSILVPYLSNKLPVALTKVREVILQRDSLLKVFLRKYEMGGMATVIFFKNILPNLDILDIGFLAASTPDITALPLNNLVHGTIQEFRAASVFRCTADLGHSGCHFSLDQPYSLWFSNNMNMSILREIHIDPFGVLLSVLPIILYCKEYSQLEQETWFDHASDSNGGGDWVLLQEYPNLERVTLKHAEYQSSSTFNNWIELPQEALIKFVRHTPNLRWFCSDLTQENIAILKDKRPEVEFCN